MSYSAKTKNVNTNNNQEVLFQKLGTAWYAFSEVNGDVIYSALPTDIDPRTTKLELIEVLEDHMAKVHQTRAASKVGKTRRAPDLAA